MILLLLWALVFWVGAVFCGYLFVQLKKGRGTALTFGLTFGLLAGGLVAWPVGWLSQSWSLLQSLLVAAIATLISALLYPLATDREYLGELEQQKADIARLSEELQRAHLEYFVIDQTALYFGDIVRLVNAVYFSAQFLIPRAAIAHVQEMATSPDALVRSQGEFALVTLERLQKDSALPVSVTESKNAQGNYEDQILTLLEEKKAILLTADVTLTRAAHQQGLSAVFLPDLRTYVSPNYFIGQHLKVQVSEAGQESGQAVGYLADGTKVVINGGGALIGRTVGVQLQRIYDTVAGKMVVGTINA